MSLRGSIEGPKSKTQRLNELRTLRGRQVSSRRYRVVMELIAGSGRNRGAYNLRYPVHLIPTNCSVLTLQRDPARAFSLCVSSSRQGIFNPDYVYEANG